eukprot:1445652-Prymnesium_polylepis.2
MALLVGSINAAARGRRLAFLFEAARRRIAGHARAGRCGGRWREWYGWCEQCGQHRRRRRDVRCSGRRQSVAIEWLFRAEMR